MCNQIRITSSRKHHCFLNQWRHRGLIKPWCLHAGCVRERCLLSGLVLFIVSLLSFASQIPYWKGRVSGYTSHSINNQTTAEPQSDVKMPKPSSQSSSTEICIWTLSDWKTKSLKTRMDSILKTSLRDPWVYRYKGQTHSQGLSEICTPKR